MTDQTQGVGGMGTHDCDQGPVWVKTMGLTWLDPYTCCASRIPATATEYRITDTRRADMTRSKAGDVEGRMQPHSKRCSVKISEQSFPPSSLFALWRGQGIIDCKLQGIPRQ
eukprot:691657-Pelagomonas_calceolata.AAC.2